MTREQEFDELYQHALTIEDEVEMLKYIKQTPLLLEQFGKVFFEFTTAIGEPPIQPCTVQQVIDIFITQRYWSGIQYRIKFDIEQGFYTEYREFGLN